MESMVVVSYWIKVGLVLFGAVVAVLAALRRMRPKAAKRDMLSGIVAVVALVALVVLTRPEVSIPLLVLALVAGAGAGFIAAGIRPLVALTVALATAFLLMMAFFGEGGAFGIGVAVFAFAVGLQLGQGIHRPKAGTAIPAEPVGPPPGLDAEGVAPVSMEV